MLDLALFCFVMAFLALGVKRPFIWVLAYLYIDILAPQKIGWSITSALPISLIAFCAAFAGWLLTDSKRGTRITYRQGLMIFLLLYCFMTTGWAEYQDSALEKWDWVWKALVFAIFLPFTMTTRLRIEGVALTMVLTAAAIIISGAIKTILAGGGYGTLYLFVDDNSGIYESSTISAVAIAMIPLILWLVKHGTIFPDDWRVRTFAYALIFACLLIPVGTEARTGLVCIAALGVMLLRDAKRRMLYITGAAVLGMTALPFLPQSFYERMSTITGFEQDASASTRVAVWNWTLDYVEDHPMGGGFDAYRANKFTYEMPVVKDGGTATTVTREEVTDEARAYHSAYFEMLGEQGYPGFIAWLWLHLSGLWQMEVIRRRWKKRTGAKEQWQAPLANALQLGQAVYLVGSLFIGIAYQPFVLMLIGMQCALWLYCKKADSAAAEVSVRGNRAPLPAKRPPKHQGAVA
ncbi:putative O-glycosylation ligase, exosortase A system-associated [Sphingomonadaceae bacterium]|nr:putative O-glycosylation ligase, exosortase A system-associated [Sphingomonadaceae bacterium]